MQKNQNETSDSDFIRSVRFLERTGGLPPHMASATRELRGDEIRHLEHGHNVCADWSLVRVSMDFRVDRLLGNHFIGRCVLGTFRDDGRLPAGIYHSTIRDSVIGDDAVVYRCPMIEDTILDRSVTMIGSRSSSDCENIEDFAGCRFSNAFANGMNLALGPSDGRREIPVFADLNRELLDKVLGGQEDDDRNGLSLRGTADDYRHSGDIPWCYVGPDAVVDNSRLRGSWVGACARIEDLAEVAGSTLLSSPTGRTTVRRGAIVEDSIVQRGCLVVNFSLVRRSVLLEGSTCRRHAVVSESIIGPTAHVSRLVVEHDVLGPGTFESDANVIRGAINRINE